LNTLLHDVRHAIRTLRKSPAFALVAILTLAVAISANAVVFAVVTAVLINPLPYGDPDRLVTIVESDSHTSNAETVSAATFADVRRQSESFEQLSLWGDGSIRLVEAGRSEMIRGMVVSANFFDTLAVPMYLGRSFRPDEDRPGHEHVLILTYRTWSERFGGDPHIVGRAVPTLDGAYTASASCRHGSIRCTCRTRPSSRACSCPSATTSTATRAESRHAARFKPSDGSNAA
jgi:putative ABC transport system permease protein